VQGFDGDWKNYVDHAVYSSLQNFRMLWSQKEGSGRVKKLVENFKFDGKMIKRSQPKGRDEELRELKKSLLGYYFDSKIVKLTSNGTIEEKKTESLQMISSEMEKKAMEFLEKREDAECFSFRENIPGYILLWRLKPSYCELCDRIHETDNPFLSIDGDTIMFNCRRKGHPQKLGRSSVFREKKGIFGSSYVNNNKISKVIYECLLFIGDDEPLRIGDDKKGYIFEKLPKKKIQTKINFDKTKFTGLTILENQRPKRKLVNLR
jgi:hypothetical protein